MYKEGIRARYDAWCSVGPVSTTLSRPVGAASAVAWKCRLEMRSECGIVCHSLDARLIAGAAFRQVEPTPEPRSRFELLLPAGCASCGVEIRAQRAKKWCFGLLEEEEEVGLRPGHDAD